MLTRSRVITFRRLNWVGNRFCVVRSSPPKYIDLLPEQQSRIDKYLEQLFEWNTRMNLTAVAEYDAAIERHVNDSLALLPLLDSAVAGRTNVSLLDVGSGPGLPGFILAIARPEWQVTLLDSLRKRCTFCYETAKMLQLNNVHVKWSRAEDAGQEEGFREAFHIVVARAVAELRILAELCLPLTAVNGTWIAAKGSYPEDEVTAARQSVRILGGRIQGTFQVDSWAAGDVQRSAVLVQKIAPTPSKYPRRAGTPQKQPL